MTLVELERQWRMALENYYQRVLDARAVGRRPTLSRDLRKYEDCLIDAHGDREQAWIAFELWHRHDPENVARLVAKVKRELNGP
jgi:hypothetical protein